MRPIKVVPYGLNLLRHLAEEIVKGFYRPDDPLSLHRVRVIFPHRRPALYLKHYLSQLLGRTFLPPRVYALEDLLVELAPSVESPPRRLLPLADRAWILFREAQDLGVLGGGERFDSFFPWGIRLSELFEECFKEMTDPLSIPYPEGLPERAKALLEDLSSLWRAYLRALEQGGWTTPGKRMADIARTMGRIPWEGEGTFIAGFYALTEAEDRILRALWERGGRVYWQAGEELPPLYRRWKESWGAELERIPGEDPRPRLHFVEAYDTHSEIAEALKAVELPSAPDRQAIVLPDPSALIPLLHELPQGAEVNVTLGYPLERTALWGLLDRLMKLQEGRDQEGRYYYGDYLPLIRHPYLKRLRVPSGVEARILFHYLEERVREIGRPFMSLEEIEALVDQGAQPFLRVEGMAVEEAREFLGAFHRRVIGPWEGVGRVSDLVEAVEAVLSFCFDPLEVQGGNPLDREFLHTLRNRLLPELRRSLFAQEPIGRDLAFSLLRKVVSVTRTPFEGEPLVNLQVLGLLETRLLKFAKVVVLDLNEGILPRHEEVDPLLPPSLRPLLGLKEREREEEITWYHFQRLVRSAEEVHLLWRNQAYASPREAEGRTQRSRFLERILWEEERRRGELLEGEIRRPALVIPPRHFLPPEGLEKAKDRLWLKLRAISENKGISPSLLETYLQCPLKFYYKYVLDLSPPKEVVEEVEGDVLGEVIHKALEDYFRPFLGATYDPEKDNDPDRLFALFSAHFEASPLKVIGLEKRFFLMEAVRYRFEELLKGIGGPFKVLQLEREVVLPLRLLGADWTFFGRIDRLDWRDGFRVVVDYKTGLPRDSRRFSPLWEVPEGLDYEGLRELAKRLPDLQLQLYVLMVTQGDPREVERTTAAYLYLSETRDQMESFLLRPREVTRRREEWVRWFGEGLPRVLEHLLRHILESPLYWRATEERACSFCEYEPGCPFAW